MPQTLLGFDFGRLRIGVAVGNTVTRSAEALAIVDAEPLEQRWRTITALVEQWRPDAFVVGRPVVHAPDPPDVVRGQASSVLETAARCERFGRQLAGRFGLRVEFVDESGSSLAAAAELARRRAQAGGRRKRGEVAAADDAEAAAIILRQYLSQP